MTGRKYRIFVGIFCPPVLCSCLMTFPILLFGGEEGYRLIPLFTLVAPLIALVVMGLPSLVFSLLMELYINPRIANSWVVIAIAAIIGFVCGFILHFGFAIYGAITGALVGWHLRKNFLENSG